MTWVLDLTVIACLLVSIVTDLASRIIPNSLVLVVLACGLWFQVMAEPEVLMLSLLGAMVTLTALGILAAYDLLGWGDVKLITAVTLIVPPNHVIGLVFAIVMAGGLLSCCYLGIRFVLRKAPPRARSDGPTLVFGRLARRESARIRANEPMPYAFAILGGVAYVLAAG
jgi:Flp pilus assembly protein protease CpaA